MALYRRILLVFCWLFFSIALPHVWAADAENVQPPDEQRAPLAVKEAPVIIWGRTIVVFRQPFNEYSPENRAKRAVERLNQIPSNLPEYKVIASDGEEGGKKRTWIRVNGRIIFGILEGDEDAVRGESFDALKKATVQAVQEWLEARREQHAVPLFMRSLGLSVAAILFAVLTFFLLRRLSGLLLSIIGRYASQSRREIRFAGVNVVPYFFYLASGLVKILEGIILVSGGYILLTLEFALFPYTQPWAEELSEYLLGILQGLVNGVFRSIPGLVTVAVILFLARLLVNIVTAFFRVVEQNSGLVHWFEPETAKATRRIVIVLIWVFALIVAYPMIPGSETKAFQGVSVFLGLMLSLGSAGLVGQIIGGIVAVYTKSFRAGDYVRIGENEGIVQELGILAAKILTIRKEEITIPNALLMSSTTTNFTRQAGHDGAIVTTGVTIGYDAPWRQVHAMLEIAAGRSKGIRPLPKPFVLQKALSDFYVEYTLMFRVERPEQRYFILSELHGHIQDVFNEHGVQIMSPHYRGQPDKTVVVPKEEWFAEPARPAQEEQGDTGR